MAMSKISARVRGAQNARPLIDNETQILSLEVIFGIFTST